MVSSSAAPNCNSSAPLQLSPYDPSRSDAFPDDILAMIYGFVESAPSAPNGDPCQFEMIREESRTLFHPVSRDISLVFFLVKTMFVNKRTA